MEDKINTISHTHSAQGPSIQIPILTKRKKWEQKEKNDPMPEGRKGIKNQK